MALLEIAIAIGVVLVVLVVVANRKGKDVIVTPTSVNLKLEPVTTATVSVTLMYTPFPRWFRSARRIAGTITVTNAGSIVQVAAVNASTAVNTPATFTVSPALVGTGKLVFDGSSTEGAHDSALVDYTVTRT